MQHLAPHAMPPAPPTHPAPSGDSLPSGRHPFALQGKIYVIRIIYAIMVFAMLATNDGLCRDQPLEHGWLLIVLAIYPHIGHLLFGRFDIRRLRGRTMLFIDGLLAGAVITALDFAGTASAFIVAIHLFNWMVIGGLTLAFSGTLTLAAGLLITAGAGDIVDPALASCHLPDWLSAVFLIGYLLIVAGLIHRLVQELGRHQLELQAESDALRHAKAMTEGALLAALPPGTAQRLADQGKIDPEDIDDATLLLLTMGIEPARHPTLELRAEWLQACDLILTRHGFELVKTFDRMALALGRTATPEDGIAALREIDAYFSNHGPAGLFAGERFTTRAALGSGPVRIGLVQEERLNIELTGAAADSLAELTVVLAAPTATRLAITPTARQRLHDATGYVLHPGDGRLPPHFRPAGNGAAE